MSKHRNCVSNASEGGTHSVLEVPLNPVNGQVDEAILQGQLDKWQRLFTVQVAFHICCPDGLFLYVLQPDTPLTDAEAEMRSRTFYEDLRMLSPHPERIRISIYTGRELNDISKFMQLFVKNLTEAHKRRKPLRERPAVRDRFKQIVMDPLGLPPVFTEEQLRQVRARMAAVKGMKPVLRVMEAKDLQVGPEVIGGFRFCRDYLKKRDAVAKEEDARKNRKPEKQYGFPRKRIMPVEPAVISRLETAFIMYETAPEEDGKPLPARIKLEHALYGLSEFWKEVAEYEHEQFSRTVYGRLFPDYIGMEMELLFLPARLTALFMSGLLRWYNRIAVDRQKKNRNSA